MNLGEAPQTRFADEGLKCATTDRIHALNPTS
jgi:hypothetical protein